MRFFSAMLGLADETKKQVVKNFTRSQIGNKYVISFKPNPAVLAETQWNPAKARDDIRSFLEKTQGNCHVEIILKDISTVRYQPQRLWEWETMAMEEIEKYES